MRLLFTLGVAVLAAGMSASAAQAQAQPGLINSLESHLVNQPVPTAVSSEPQARAYRIERLAENHVRLTGSVEIHNASWQISADRVELFTDESRLVATGNVVFISADGRIAAARVEFDTDTETGTFHNVIVPSSAGNP